VSLGLGPVKAGDKERTLLQNASSARSYPMTSDACSFWSLQYCDGLNSSCCIPKRVRRFSCSCFEAAIYRRINLLYMRGNESNA